MAQFEFPCSAADLKNNANANYLMVLVQIPMCNEMEVSLSLRYCIAMLVI